MVNYGIRSVTYEAEVSGVGVDESPGHLGLALLPDGAPEGGGGDADGGRRALHLVVGRDGGRQRRRRFAALVVLGRGVEAVAAAPDPLPGRRGRGAALRRGGLLAVGGCGGHHVVDLALQLRVLGHHRPQHLAEPLVLLADALELRLQRLHL
jgi:hypothetical protein